MLHVVVEFDDELRMRLVVAMIRTKLDDFFGSECVKNAICPVWDRHTWPNSPYLRSFCLVRDLHVLAISY